MTDADQLNAEIKRRRAEVLSGILEGVHNWDALRSYAQMRIEKFKNDLADCDPNDTAQIALLQGRIAEARELAKLRETATRELGSTSA